MRRLFAYILLLPLGVISSCITEYTPSKTVEVEGILVVEGFIGEGTSSITIARSAGIGTEPTIEEPDINTPVKDAVVYVECEDGTLYYSQTTWSETGIYEIDIDRLDEDKKYRLRIACNGLNYASTYLNYKKTPEITDITFTKPAAGEPLAVGISTVGENDGARYYIWSYEDIWEYHVQLMADSEFDAYGNIVLFTEFPNYMYYCWGYGTSTSLLLGSTNGLSENRFTGYTLLEIPPTSQKLTYIYYIKVKQNCITKEAYDYFTTLKRNSENTGGLFPPVISEMKGNITCIEDPDVPVIGYVDISMTSYKELFTDLESYSEFDLFCPIESERVDTSYTILTGAGYPDYMEWTLIQCVDCRSFGGKKNKPSFWPNDHE